MTLLPPLNVYRLDSHAKLPAPATQLSACFDLNACLENKTIISYRPWTHEPYYVTIGDRKEMDLLPHWRYMIPTGLIFEIPQGFSVRIHIRSGQALRYGLSLVNNEGVVDEDFRKEVMVLLQNNSDVPFRLVHGDRIAQGELVRTEKYTIEEIFSDPGQVSDRTGGFGSTGTT